MGNRVIMAGKAKGVALATLCAIWWLAVCVALCFGAFPAWAQDDGSGADILARADLGAMTPVEAAGEASVLEEDADGNSGMPAFDAEAAQMDAGGEALQDAVLEASQADAGEEAAGGGVSPEPARPGSSEADASPADEPAVVTDDESVAASADDAIMADLATSADECATEPDVAEGARGGEASGSPTTQAPAEADADVATAHADIPAKSSTADAVATVAPAVAAKAAKSAKPAVAASTVAAKKVAATVKAGWYSLRSAQSTSLYLQVKGSKAQAGNAVVLAKAGTATGQAFKLVKSGSYYRLQSGAGLSYRIQVNAKGDVVLATGGGKRALYRLEAVDGNAYRLVNVATGKALAIPGGATAGSRIVAADASGAGKAATFSLLARPGLLQDGIYSIRTVLSGKRALAPRNASRAAGASAAVSDYTKSLSQKWQVKAVAGKVNTYTLENIATGLRLQSAGAKAAKLKKASASTAQMWVAYGVNGKVVFKNKGTGKALQLKKGKSAAGTLAVGAKRTDKKAQRWTLAKAKVLESGIYEFDSAANSALALEIKGGSNAGAAIAQVGADADSLHQRWYYDAASKTISSVNSGKLLSLKGGQAVAGAAAVQLDNDGSATQKWNVEYAGGGALTLVSGASSAIVLQAGGTTAGSAVAAAAATGAKAQAWKAVEAGDATTGYVSLDFTLDQMARWQKSKNPYISSYTLTALKNALNPDKGTPYKFLDLRTSCGASASTLDKFILTGGANGKLKGLGAAFVAAAQECKINEVYLLAHAIWESGWGTSELASGYKYAGGTIDGKKYKKGTYYNFFGIGAYDSSPLSGGRKMAIINGWNSPQKAVTGAAKWIAGNYIYGTNFSAGSRYPQPTLYDMKWDTSRSKAVKGYAWHQYATDPNWAEGIGSLMGNCLKLVNPTVMHYIKPRYK